MKAKWMSAVVLSGAVAVLIYTQSVAAPRGTDSGSAGDGAAPAFALKDVFGKEFKLSDFKGKTVVLEWMNRNCPASIGCHDKSTMQETYKKYAAKGVVWLAVDSTKDAEAELDRVYAAEKRLAYPVLMDSDGKVGRAFGATRTPHMFVIDKAGRIAYRGAVDDQKSTNYIAAALDNILAGQPVDKPKTEPYGCGIKYK